MNSNDIPVQNLPRTIFYRQHLQAGATMVNFGGFAMPVKYGSIFQEHAAVRRYAGLFDISHMGRLDLTGSDVFEFLQKVTTNNVALLEPGMSQYSLIPSAERATLGFPIDDAYVYRNPNGNFRLVVNAGHTAADLEHLTDCIGNLDVEITDRSEDLAMMALQGPNSEAILQEILNMRGSRGRLPQNKKNTVSEASVFGRRITIAKTGYTGEPNGYEIIVPRKIATKLWGALLEKGNSYGIALAGLGARDSLRTEAGFPLGGHEIGLDPLGRPIPAVAHRPGYQAVRFEGGKEQMIGRDVLLAQHMEVTALRKGNLIDTPLEERLITKLLWPFQGLNRAGDGLGNTPVDPGAEVYVKGNLVGHVTSGTTAPVWIYEKDGVTPVFSNTDVKRPIGIAYIDTEHIPSIGGVPVEIKKVTRRTDRNGNPSGDPRVTMVPSLVVRSNLRQLPPYSRPVIHPEDGRTPPFLPSQSGLELMGNLVDETEIFARGRKEDYFNLIPSEQRASPLVRFLTLIDQGGYDEHRRVLALGRCAKDMAFYRGVEFRLYVQEQVVAFMRDYFPASEIEPRPISGQNANLSVYGGMVRWLNLFKRGEPQRMPCVAKYAVNDGGHISHDEAGGLRHYVQVDPKTGRHAILNIPLHPDDPFRPDLDLLGELLEEHQPTLFIAGRSLKIYPEPTAAFRQLIDQRSPHTILHEDDAHDNGLYRPGYGQPCKNGAHIATGSLHKTFPGTNRGIIASNMSEGTTRYDLWRMIQDEVMPGKHSNTHPETMLGLLGACYEMMDFGNEYQLQVHKNAKAFARALSHSGLKVFGDSNIGYTETHQVLIDVGRNNGPSIAERLEDNYLITNAQSVPIIDAGFSDGSGIRMGVQEMTRFGMKENDFEQLAEYMADVILRDHNRAEDIRQFRRNFTRQVYTWHGNEADEMANRILSLA